MTGLHCRVVRAAVVGGALATAAAAGGAPTPPAAEVSRGVALHFEPNAGQTGPKVEFLARGPGYRLFLTATEAVLSLGGGAKGAPAGEGAGRGRRSRAKAGPSAVLRMRLVGARARPAIEGLDEQPGRSHYFMGSDPRRWRANVPHYARVRYRHVYPGIDLVFHGRGRSLEYDFVVAPGADSGRIRLGFEGARRIRVDARGRLAIDLGNGEVVQDAPLVYQEAEGVRKEIAGRYVIKGDRQVAFEVGPHDRTAALVIDPVLVYSTYLGGTGADTIGAMTLDDLGYVYVTGETDSPDFPTAASPPQGSLHAPPDVVISKLGPGSALIYSTYLGGNDDDGGFGIAVDGSGNAYVTGYTMSTNFPTAGTPSQPGSGGGIDGFVTKLGPTGSLVYSTYFGGSNSDWGSAVAVDGSGNAYLTGITGSSDFPTAGAPSQPAYGGGFTDTFALKLDSASARMYSTYLGGSDTEYGLRYSGIAIDGSGNAYVAGSTRSTNFPTAGTPSQGANAGGYDGFVTKLGPSSTRVYSTYLGGAADDYAYAIAVDAGGSAYVAGTTQSLNFPTAGTPSQGASGGGSDGFVTRLGGASARLLSTYLGGSGSDTPSGIAVHLNGYIYVAGETSSSNFPTSGDPLQTARAGGLDAFVTQMTGTSARGLSTYLGGAGDEFVNGGIKVDWSGNAFIAGYTASADFPTAGTPGQAGNAGGPRDGFVARIFEPTPGPPSNLYTVSPCRAIDTRDPLGRGPLQAGTERVLTITGKCDIPAGAKAVSVNVAVTDSTAGGNLRLFDAAILLPAISTINYSPGQARSNNAIVPLSTAGQLAARCAQPSGTAHLILDVNGYFQ